MLAGTQRKSSLNPKQDVFETDLKARDIAMERRARKKSKGSNASRNSIPSVEGQLNIPNQGKRKRSNAHEINGSSNNLTILNEKQEPSPNRNRKSIPRAMPSSALDSRDISYDGSSRRKLSDIEKHKQKTSSVTNPERKSSKDKSCAVGIEKSA